MTRETIKLEKKPIGDNILRKTKGVQTLSYKIKLVILSVCINMFIDMHFVWAYLESDI